MIIFRERNDENPSPKYLVFDITTSKDSTGNTKLYEKVFTNLLSPDLVKHCGRNTSVHKNDKKYSRSAFKDLVSNWI